MNALEPAKAFHYERQIACKVNHAQVRACQAKDRACWCASCLAELCTEVELHADMGRETLAGIVL